MMDQELTLLDRIEEIRQKAAENPKNYPTDYTIRLIIGSCSGICRICKPHRLDRGIEKAL